MNVLYVKDIINPRLKSYYHFKFTIYLYKTVYQDPLPPSYEGGTVFTNTLKLKINPITINYVNFRRGFIKKQINTRLLDCLGS